MTFHASATRRRRARRWAAVPLALSLLAACGSGQGPAPRDDAADDGTGDGTEAIVDLTERLLPLEERYEAVVGLYAFDLDGGGVVAHRDQERFAFASTIKSLAAGAVLDRIDDGELTDTVTFTDADLVPHSPVTERHVDEGMTLHEVIEAAIRDSDNTAANLLFERLGGPDGLQSALRELGDETTNVSRWEPDLNAFTDGDDRDTTTAQALATTMSLYATGTVLDDASREVLLEAMRGVRTGDGTIRAGVPDDWEVANKTGTGAHGTRNDVAVLWPDDGRDPIVLAVMTRTLAPDGEPDDALLAEATAVAVDALAPERADPAAAPS